MASKTIKGLTIEIGGDTTKLGKALEDVNKKSRNLSSELGEINKLLKMDPGNADLLAQKQKVLADAVSNTKEKLERLKEAEKQVQEQFERGEVSEEQVRALQREIVATTKKLDGYEKAAEDTAEKLKKLGDNSDDAAKEIDDVADKADKAERETEELGSSLDGTLSSGLKAVTALAAGAAAAIVGCVEASHEYRTEMGKLDVAFQTSGHSSEAAKATYKELQSVLGETDQAVEASNHLAKLADNEEELSQLTDALVGVYATFGASLPIEGLAEAANETAKVGKVTGSFADAINWAADKGTDWNKILGNNKKAMAAFEKATSEGEKTEDAFTAALEACSDEQERQELITSTLTKLYGKAATQYKKTNKEVIESNKANEEWNETLAEVGGELAPVVTEVKKFGAELLKNAKEPLKDVASFLGDKVLPALGNLARWVTSNTPTIKAAIVGVTAALVAYKVATIAAEVAQKGIKGAIMATEVAQKALTLAMNATPWGLAATAIAGVVAVLAVYYNHVTDVSHEVSTLSDETKKLSEKITAEKEAVEASKKAYEDKASAISSESKYYQDLVKELDNYVDADGRVNEADQGRVNFIKNQLKEAYGIEIETVGGVISKYGELKEIVSKVIETKVANALLEAKNEEYIQAIANEDSALSDLNTAYDNYVRQRTESTQKIEGWSQQMQEHETAWYEALWATVTFSDTHNEKLQENIQKENELLDGLKKDYEAATENYGQHYTTIQQYEEAALLIQEGKTKEAIALLQNKSNSYFEYSADVDEATKEEIKTLYKAAVEAGLAAKETKKNFEDGVDGFTKDMVKESEDAYEDALDAWAEAYNAGNAVGTDLGGGLKAGMESTVPSLITKAKGIIDNIWGAMKKAAESNSPSKKTIRLGGDMGEGLEIGMEEKTTDLLKTARNQMSGIMSAYKDEGDSAPAVMRSVSDKALSRSSENFQTFVNGNNSKLDQILAAIKAGQVILLDGNQVVGGTSDRMDNALGQRRALVERGAL